MQRRLISDSSGLNSLVIAEPYSMTATRFDPAASQRRRTKSVIVFSGTFACSFIYQLPLAPPPPELPPPKPPKPPPPPTPPPQPPPEKPLPRPLHPEPPHNGSHQ